MTTAAGFALFHLSHTEMFVADARNIQIRMTILAAISCDVNSMAEYGGTGPEIDLLDCMTFLAI